MTTQAASLTEIVICDTCKYPDGGASRNGKPAGEAFVEALRQALSALPPGERALLRLRRFSCLMNCSRSCSAAVAPADGKNKVAYVMGDFEPDAAAAEALIGYALGHAKSDTGVVPYKTWPEGVKGHFVARVPARDEAEDLGSA